MNPIRVLSSCRIHLSQWGLLGLCALGAFGSTLTAKADLSLVLDENMDVLKAKKPDAKFRFVGSNAPGQLFLPGEKVKITLEFDTQLAKEGKSYSIEIQEITTRDPDSRVKSRQGWTDTTGNAPLICLEGKPMNVPLTVTTGDQPKTAVEISDFPLPERFGTYALILVQGSSRQFLGTLARLPSPRPGGNLENTVIFGESVLIESDGRRSDYYQRMGLHGYRAEFGWNEKEDGSVDWTRFDACFKAAKEAGCQLMVTLGGHPAWTRPFEVPTPAARWTPKTNGYGGTGDWLCKPELDGRYAKWLEAFMRRYWEDGKGALWGVENYNEPWEGGGISGWASDVPRYRQLQKLIATTARKVDPKIKVLASSSIMNTEDKLFSDGLNEMEPYIDVFTDHYVPPVNCYGPMVAKAHGKTSVETETWLVATEYQLPQGVVQFLASGQNRISPWHPRVLFDTVPGSKEKYLIPTPVVAATAAFNALVTGKKFEKMAFTEHLPYAFQFGKDEDKDGVMVVFGRLIPISSTSFRVLPWEQVNASEGGTMTIDNHDGLLEFYDLAGNRQYQKEKVVTLPMNFVATYIKSTMGPGKISERLNTAKIQGKRGIEIIPQNFHSLPSAKGAVVSVEVRNRLNCEMKGTLKVNPPEGLTLTSAEQAVKLAPGESRRLDFEIANAKLSSSNAYRFNFEFSSSSGNASYAETLSAAVAPRRTIKIDGNLDEWADIPGVTVVGSKDNGDVTELLRRPWLEIQKDNPAATAGELKMAWDDDFLYVCARVNDPTPEAHPIRFSERDENSYFHSAKSDQISPYKEFIEAYRAKTGDPKRSFAEVPYVYCKSPEEGIPFRRDRLQLAFDVKPGLHDLQQVTEVSKNFHAVPDTDYEYSLYWVDDGKNGGGELWRHLAPGVPRVDDWPHQTKSKNCTGVVPGAKQVVIRNTNGYVYEVAIPRSELAELKYAAGTEFGFTFAVGNSKGANAYYGGDKAATKNNGLTLHPYWENSPDTGTRWTFID